MIANCVKLDEKKSCDDRYLNQKLSSPLCSQIFSSKTKQLIRNIKKTRDKNKSRAALQTSLLWDRDKKFINVHFIEDIYKANDILDCLPSQSFNGEDVDDEGNLLDPLQKIFDPQVDNKTLDVKEAIKKIINERYNKFCGIKFTFDNSIPHDLTISFIPAQSWSCIGKDCSLGVYAPEICRNVSMNIGWFTVGVVLHEFGHALGLIHEHQNPSSNPIKWDVSKVYNQFSGPPNDWDSKTIEQNILDPYQIDNITGSQFDPKSIMLYFFSPELTTDNLGTTQNWRLSGLDVLTLSDSRHYPGGDMTPQEFYKYAYATDIDDSLIESGKGLRARPNPYLTYYLAGGVILLLLLLFMFIF